LTDANGLLAELRRRWTWLTATLDVALAQSEPVWELLLAAYNEPWRHYHTLHHVLDTLSQLDRFERTQNDLLHLSLALWFHDVVYKPEARDNEEASVIMTSASLQQWRLLPLSLPEIERLIFITKSHQTSRDDELGHIILDADLAVLSRARTEYQRYSEQIRAEYAWVNEAAYRSGRIQLLRHFLDRPQIYHTSQFAACEAPARENLLWEIRQLQ
jgi:predicted metal-dependent HD superfamily phosphohydrolase